MPESKGVWIAKTIAIAVGTSLLVTFVVIAVQLWLTGTSHGAVAGGVGGSTAAVMFMLRRNKLIKEQQHQPKT